MNELLCPICLNTKVLQKKHKKTPTDFGFKSYDGYSIFSCLNCLCEFSYPLKPMNYNSINKKYKLYSDFVSKEEFEGRIHHVLKCTSHWNDSSIVYHLLSLLKFKGDLLDFAAGSGYITELARRAGYKVSAIEINDRLRKFIHEMIQDVVIYKSLEDVTKLNKNFDVIVALHIIEHLPDPIRILKKLHSIISQKGVLIVVVPNLDRTYYKFGEIGKEIEDQIEMVGFPGDFPPNHLSRFRAKSLRIALKKSGFKNIVTGYSLINAWDLFYSGLGDDTFKFKNYSSDIRQMKCIASVEARLNEMLLEFNIENLGNTLIALASNVMEEEYMENLLRLSRNQVMNTYLANISEQYERFLLNEKDKDKYIESLQQTIIKKDKQFEENQKSIKEVIEKKDSYIKSLEEAIKGKDTEYKKLEEAIKGKDTEYKKLEEAIKGKDTEYKKLEEAIKGKDRYITDIKTVIEQKEELANKLNEELSSIKENVVFKIALKIGLLKDI